MVELHLKAWLSRKCIKARHRELQRCVAVQDAMLRACCVCVAYEKSTQRCEGIQKFEMSLNIVTFSLGRRLTDGSAATAVFSFFRGAAPLYALLPLLQIDIAWKGHGEQGCQHIRHDSQNVPAARLCSPVSLVRWANCSNVTEEARTCEAWFQLTFRPQKWNLKAHMWYQLSPFTGSRCGDCDAARPRQHTTPGQKFFLLTSCSNPLPLDSWQVSYESHGGSRISWFAFKEFYFIPTWNTIRHAGHAKWG